MPQRPLFIYGSLRDPQVRARVLGRRTDLTTLPATLPGHIRQTVPDFDYPFIVPAGSPASADSPAGHGVDGELLFRLLPDDYTTLDEYEDVDDGLYVRAIVTAQTPGGPVEAWAYLRGPAAPS